MGVGEKRNRWGKNGGRRCVRSKGSGLILDVFMFSFSSNIVNKQNFIVASFFLAESIVGVLAIYVVEVCLG